MNFLKNNREHKNNNVKQMSKKLFLSVAVIATMSLVSCKNETKTETKVDEVKEAVVEENNSEKIAATIYQCPMECEGDKTYDEPGECPICKMDLKEVEVENNNNEIHNHE